jgi:uncharacterized membrane protein YphA (DoxX/SURF4 family)
MSTASVIQNSRAFQKSRAFLLPLSRLLMSSLFIWDGFVMLRNPSGTAQYFVSVHVPAPDVAVWLAMPIHLLGGLALPAGGLLHPVGRCFARSYLPRHRLWRASANRGPG